MNKKIFLTQVYYALFQKHLFTSISHLDKSLASNVFRILYKSSVWDTYPIDRDNNGSDILYIHIPKCAGTSIANTFGKNHLPHYPASLFFLKD